MKFAKNTRFGRWPASTSSSCRAVWGVDMTKIISLNESALYLWNALAGKEFSVDDAARLLTERYEVDDATAARDAAAWVEKLRDCKLI